MNHYPKINLLLLFFILSSCLFTTCKKEEEQPKPEAVNAAFSFDKVLINAGDSIKFIDESTGNPASWSWTFEGGTPATSVAKNPTIIYKNSGSFTVSLVVKNDVSEDTEVKEKVITVQSFLSADFTVDEQEISEGESAKFTDASIGEVIEWKWTFEGGIPATSSAQNPTVVYPQAGKYKVSLSASNPTKQNTKTIEKYIHVTCDGLYCTPQFPNYNKTENVVYGVDQTKHKMIIYEPVGDSRSERPAVLLLRGGGFTFASNLDYLEPFAINLTKYGIVVAVARYRINIQEDPAVRLIYAQQDNRTAVRYLRKEASTLKIDADNIFNGGNSSGAFTALFHA